jgi:hypothetical protein
MRTHYSIKQSFKRDVVVFGWWEVCWEVFLQSYSAFGPQGSFIETLKEELVGKQCPFFKYWGNIERVTA